MNRPCLECGELSPNSRCPEHARQVERARHDPELDTPRWRRLRKQVVAAHRSRLGYLCPGYQRGSHLAALLTVDHIVARVNGGAMYDESNLQVLCVSCNDAKGVK